jgi:predicted acyl esterase
VAPLALAWETPPLAAAVDVAGPAEIRLDAATSAIDTAWIATLQDVAPNGRTTDVTAGWLRASFHAVDEAASRPGRPIHPCDRPVPIEPNARLSYRVGLVDTARRFAPGHRIRLVLTSDDSAGTVMMGFRHAPLGLPARNTVFSTSRLLLPILAGAEGLGSRRDEQRVS